MIAPDLPLFDNLGAALRWAWYENGLRDANTVKISSCYRYGGKDSREQIADPDEEVVVHTKRFDLDARPRGYDAAAQSGLIQSYVWGMNDSDRAHLFARYLSGHERAVAHHFLHEQMVSSLEFGEGCERVIRELCKKYYGKKVKLKELVERHEISYFRVASLNRQVVMFLDATAHRAERAAHEYLSDHHVL